MLLQAMPGCDLAEFEKLRQGLRSSQTRELLGQAPNPDDPSDAILASLPLVADSASDVIDAPAPHFSCKCSRERTLAALGVLSETDRAEIRAAKEELKVICHFCGTSYAFDPQEITA
jgi:molecular chaperone Hsp33